VFCGRFLELVCRFENMEDGISARELGRNLGHRFRETAARTLAKVAYIMTTAGFEYYGEKGRSGDVFNQFNSQIRTVQRDILPKMEEM
jgi:hypothetical protein